MTDDEAFEAHLITIGANLQGINWAFEDEDDEELDDFDDEQPKVAAADLGAERLAKSRADALIKGMLWHASVTAVDLLFQALHEWDELEAEPLLKTIHPVLGSLPRRLGHNYDGLFVQKFLVATVDVTTFLAGHWQPLPTVAHELALRAILDQATVVEETHELKPGKHWRSDLEEQLFDDLDHELLFDPEMDGIEDYAELGLGIAPMDFNSWFVTFQDRPHAAPYSTDVG
jgi:hypothetical protein